MVEICSDTALISLYYAVRIGRGVVDWALLKHFM